MSEHGSLVQRLDQALVGAMKARDAVRTSTLRMVRAALKNREIEKRGSLEEAEVVQVVSSLLKQRRESIEQFRGGNRPDLVAREEAEAEILKEFLPAEMAPEELAALVARVIAQVGATGHADLGKVMGALMPLVRGKADGRKVNEAVRAALGGQR